MTVEAYYHDCLYQLSPTASSRWAEIAAAYRGRAYHNLDHLAEMLQHLTALNVPLHPASAPLFGIALIYHDIVYKAHRKDNEARSAKRAVSDLKKLAVPADQLSYCHDLIMATQHHKARTDDEGWLNDLDLAVLARPAEDYDRYAMAVRQEFSVFPDFLYRTGRKKALRALLDQESIYYHAATRELWELNARKNLCREIDRL